jgi:hypothetical protein
MKQCMVKAVNEDLTPLFSSIKQEVLLIWGDKDTGAFKGCAGWISVP